MTFCSWNRIGNHYSTNPVCPKFCYFVKVVSSERIIKDTPFYGTNFSPPWTMKERCESYGWTLSALIIALIFYSFVHWLLSRGMVLYAITFALYGNHFSNQLVKLAGLCWADPRGIEWRDNSVWRWSAGERASFHHDERQGFQVHQRWAVPAIVCCWAEPCWFEICTAFPSCFLNEIKISYLIFLNMQRHCTIFCI